MIRFRYLLILLILCLSPFFADAQLFRNRPQKKLRKINRWLTGWYHNDNQFKGDTSYGNWEAHYVRIWKSKPKEEGIWYYEQYTDRKNHEVILDQNIINIRYSGRDKKIDKYIIRFYRINATMHQDAWDEEEPLKGIAMEDLVYYDGCNLVGKYKGKNRFEFSNLTKYCFFPDGIESYIKYEYAIYKDKIYKKIEGYGRKEDKLYGPNNRGWFMKKQEDIPVDKTKTGAKPPLNGGTPPPPNDTPQEGGGDINTAPAPSGKGG